MHAPHHLTVDALRAPERAWPLAWSSGPLGAPTCSSLGVRRRKSPIPSSESLMRLSITLVKSDGLRGWKQYSGSDSTADYASSAKGTYYSTEGLKGYPTVLVWVLSAAAVSRYKVIKVMARGLRFGITCVKSDKFRPKAPENPSGPPFSAASSPNERATQGSHSPEGKLFAAAGIRGSFSCWADLIREQVWPEGPLAEGFTQEVQS